MHYKFPLCIVPIKNDKYFVVCTALSTVACCMRRRKLCVSINYRKCSPAIYMNQAGAWRRFKLPFNCWTDPNRRSFSLIFTLPPALKVASLPALLRLLCTKKKKKKKGIKKKTGSWKKQKPLFVCWLVCGQMQIQVRA